MNVSNRIKQLTAQHSWTEYRLVKESGLPASTISNIFHRGTTPGIPTIEILCETFGISLSQFFEDENHNTLSKELFYYNIFHQFLLNNEK